MLFPPIIILSVLKPDPLNFKFETFMIAMVDVFPFSVVKRYITHCVDPTLAFSHLLECFLLERYHQSRGRNFNVDFVIFKAVVHTFRDSVNLALQLVKLVCCL